MKTINFKIDDNELERLNYYRDTPEGGNAAQADFIKQSIKEKCEKVRNLRSGGFSIDMPTPENYLFTDDEKAKTIQVLTQAVADLAKSNHYATGYLTELIAYLQYHFYNMPDKQRKEFHDNFYKDIEFDNKLDQV